MTALAHQPQPEPRSGENALTSAKSHFPQGAAGWMAFFRVVSKLHDDARARGRTYLQWDEWNKFFLAAVRFGCVERDELGGDIVPLADYSAAHPRANKRLGSLFRALLVEQYRQVRERKAAGDSPWQFAQWMRANCAAYDAAQSERARKATEQRQATTVVSSLHDRKSRRRRDIDDVDDQPPLPETGGPDYGPQA
jgi:hypothetical protein